MVLVGALERQQSPVMVAAALLARTAQALLVAHQQILGEERLAVAVQIAALLDQLTRPLLEEAAVMGAEEAAAALEEVPALLVQQIQVVVVVVHRQQTQLPLI